MDDSQELTEICRLLSERVVELEAENKRLREALGCTMAYQHHVVPTDEDGWMEMVVGMVRIARDALKGAGE